jgi:hypothetical protein
MKTPRERRRNSATPFAKWLLGVLLAELAITPVHAQPVMFDFNQATQYSPLPVELTQNGITAHLSATGQGYSIQSAGTMGFTPAGFDGLAIYPSSIYAADLLISFSVPLVDLSILCAPQELACDSSATIRVSAYMGTNFVATNTTTAPVPGTWPTAVVGLSAAQGFNNVVIHYESAPPTGGDWGPIFMADNMIVIPLDPVFANGFD